MASSPSPAGPPEYQFGWAQAQAQSNPHYVVSPPLLALAAVLSAAILIVLYANFLSRPLHHLLTRLRSSPFPPPSDSPHSSPNHFLSSSGLDDSVIRSIPTTLYRKTKLKFCFRDCAVCLIEFADDEKLRSLPNCGHLFHVDCVDLWLKSHATCPICRAAIFPPETSPPVRIPDDVESEIVVVTDSPERRALGFERSFSFGFEREVMVTESVTPWGEPRFWSKRWGTPRVLLWTRRTRSAGGRFGSSRFRCGDPEALVSPERLERRG